MARCYHCGRDIGHIDNFCPDCMGWNDPPQNRDLEYEKMEHYLHECQDRIAEQDAEIARLQARIEELEARCEDYEDDHKSIMVEACEGGIVYDQANGPRHCTCVPGLRAIVREQQSRIEELEQANRWIPVEERLPEWPEDEVWPNILAYDAYYRVSEAHWGIVNPDYPEGVWHPVNSDDEMDNVTHWRPLPEPPGGTT